MARCKQFRLLVGVGIVGAHKVYALRDLAVRSDQMGSVRVHSEGTPAKQPDCYSIVPA